MFDDSSTRRIQGFLTGFVTGTPTAEQVIAALVAPASAQIRTVMCETDVAAAGTAIIDLRINGVSAYTNPARRPSLPAGQSGTFMAAPPDHSAVQRGDRVTLVVVNSGNKTQFIATAALEEP